VERAVATCGTAMADEHFGVLRNFAKRVVLAYDADGAGQAAASRFYEWERRHEIDVAVADLPAGADPGELSRSDPEALRAAVEGAKPFLQFRVERVLSAADLSTPEGRAKAADAALSAVAEHPDDLVRDQYVMQVAERCRLEPASLRDRLERLRREGPKEPVAKRGSGPNRSGADDAPSWVRDPDDPWDRGEPDGDEEGPPPEDGVRPGRGAAPSFGPGLEVLRFAIHRPEDVAHRLEPALFGDDLQRSALLVLLEADDLRVAIAEASPPVRDLLARLVVEEPIGEPDGALYTLIRLAARRELAVLERESRTSPEAGAELVEMRPVIEHMEVTGTIGEASDRLVAWLVGRGT
jgi:DNA primase